MLNDGLTAELTAINQYFIHARMCENWGYERLWKKIRSESIGEMRHADELIARILYLEGTPNLQKLGKVNVGQTVPEQLRLDLELEKAAVTMLNQAIETCRSLADHGSRDLLEEIAAAVGREAPTRLDRLGEHGDGPLLQLEIEPQLLRDGLADRSEERRVGEEGRSRWSPYH